MDAQYIRTHFLFLICCSNLAVHFRPSKIGFHADPCREREPERIRADPQQKQTFAQGFAQSTQVEERRYIIYLFGWILVEVRGRLKELFVPFCFLFRVQFYILICNFSETYSPILINAHVTRSLLYCWLAALERFLPSPWFFFDCRKSVI